MILLITAMSALVGTVLARGESCVPATDVFQGPNSPNWVPCAATRISDSVIEMTCGVDLGSIRYNYKDNVISVQSGSQAKQGQFTIHGACREGRRQVAHLDFYTPATGQTMTFPGMNRKCDITKAGTHPQFSAYTLTQTQIDACIADHPIIPGH